MAPPVRHLLLALAFIGTYGLTRAVAPVAPAVPATLAKLPMTLAPWAGVTAPPLPPEVLEVLAADDYLRRYYYARAAAPLRQTEAEAAATHAARSPDGADLYAVEMDVSYYAQPRVGANMHSPLNCLPGSGWQITRMVTVPLPGADGVRVKALTVQRGERRFAMAYWFQNHDRVITGEASTRFQLLADALRRRPTDTGIVRVMAPIADGSSADVAVMAFASRLVPELAKLLTPQLPL